MLRLLRVKYVNGMKSLMLSKCGEQILKEVTISVRDVCGFVRVGREIPKGDWWIMSLKLQ